MRLGKTLPVLLALVGASIGGCNTKTVDKPEAVSTEQTQPYWHAQFVVSFKDKQLSEDQIKEMLHPLNIVEVFDESEDGARVITIGAKDSNQSYKKLESQIGKIHGVESVRFNSWIHEPRFDSETNQEVEGVQKGDQTKATPQEAFKSLINQDLFRTLKPFYTERNEDGLLVISTTQDSGYIYNSMARYNQDKVSKIDFDLAFNPDVTSDEIKKALDDCGVEVVSIKLISPELNDYKIVTKTSWDCLKPLIGE